ncbi:MAG: YggS family pyridoxal phosphate-dependent enzyme [Deltaproteobacteria bacterium]|nr:MAG: YggS family pyridoxal phosphate-dependent enzyme [Deltaproteobacteria bacterium]
MIPPPDAPGEGVPIRERVAWLADRISGAERRAGRSPGAVTLVAVSKTQPLERVLEARAAGLSVFGENYVQEAEGKIPSVPGAEWHLIGKLQGNKVRRAVSLFSWIQTADSPKRLAEISRCAVESGKLVPVLLEVNVGAEESKAGISPEALRAVAESACGLPGVRVAGLMAIPPHADDPSASRPHFARLRGLLEALAREFPGMGLRELSMGMSNDFEAAIEEGATMIRIGTALFGGRSAGGRI